MNRRKSERKIPNGKDKQREVYSWSNCRFRGNLICIYHLLKAIGQLDPNNFMYYQPSSLHYRYHSFRKKKNSNPKGLDQLFPFFRLLLPFFDRSCCYVGSQLKGISCCIIYVFETIATKKNSAEPTRNDHHDVSYIHNLSIRMSLMIIIQKF